MVGRIAGGALAGWLLSLAPLALINALSLSSGAVDPSSTALAGASALAVGILLGGLAAGLIGGRRGGALAGAIAGALCAASLIALWAVLRAQNDLPVLVALHPLRTLGALLFIGALVACIALGVAAILGWRAGRAEARSMAAFAAARDSRPRPRDAGAQPRGPSQPRPVQRGMSAPRQDAGGWPPAQRQIPPASGPRPPRDPRDPRDSRRDDQWSAAAGYDPRDRWPDAPERW